jgi:hypothetical protein
MSINSRLGAPSIFRKPVKNMLISFGNHAVVGTRGLRDVYPKEKISIFGLPIRVDLNI